jgi:hypothetical protein
MHVLEFYVLSDEVTDTVHGVARTLLFVQALDCELDVVTRSRYGIDRHADYAIAFVEVSILIGPIVVVRE